MLYAALYSDACHTLPAQTISGKPRDTLGHVTCPLAIRGAAPAMHKYCCETCNRRQLNAIFLILKWLEACPNILLEQNQKYHRVILSPIYLVIKDV